MRVVGQPAGEDLVVEVLRDALVHQDRAERAVARRDRLPAGDHVGDHVEVLEGEELPRAPEPDEHLVANQERAMLVARRAYRLEVAIGRDEHAVGAHDRLEDHGGHVLFEREQSRDLRAGRQLACFLVQVHHMDGADQPRLDGGATPVARHRDRPHRRPMVAAIARHDLVAAGHQARDLQRVLVGVAAAEREEDLGEAGGSLGQQRFGERDLLRIGHVRHRDAQPLGLRFDGVDDPAVPVSGVHLVDEPAEIEEASDGRVEVRSRASGQLDGTRAALRLPGEEEGIGHARGA